MENRERENNDSSVEFGSSIGRSENLEGGEMDRKKNRDESSMGKESSRRSGSGELGSSPGRSGSVGNKDLGREESTPRSGPKDNSGNSGIGGSSSGRH